MLNLAILFLLASLAFAQTGTLNVIGGRIDFSSVVHTSPTIVVANVPSLPATCNAGELAVVTAATLGQQIYQCSAGNVWTQQLNSGTATGGGITVYSGTGLTVTANTYYLPIGGGGTLSTTETNVDVDSPSAATITNFYVQQNVAIGAGNTATYTWRKNASSQSVTCQIAGAVATSCSDTTHSFSVSQGDLLTIQLVTTGTIIVTPNITMAAQFGNITATGTVNMGTIGQFGYYAANGSAISGISLFAVNGQTGTYQVLAADFTACKAITVASGTFTVTLVASGAQPTTGQCIHVINYGSGVVTIARSGQNINGGTASLTVPAASATAPSAAWIVSDGTNYFGYLAEVPASTTCTTQFVRAVNGTAAATCASIANADLPTLTYTQSVFGGANLIPDSSGNVFAEPFTILSGTAFFAYNIMAFADTSTLDCMYTRWNVPINYTTGATTWIIDWNTTATTGNAVWTLDYRDVSTATLAATTSQESLTVTTAASGTASARTQSTMTATASNFSAGDIIQIRVCRNGAGSDTIAATLAIHDIRFSFVGRP